VFHSPQWGHWPCHFAVWPRQASQTWTAAVRAKGAPEWGGAGRKIQRLDASTRPGPQIGGKLPQNKLLPCAAEPGFKYDPAFGSRRRQWADESQRQTSLCRSLRHRQGQGAQRGHHCL
jgi:hypothetical protein